MVFSWHFLHAGQFQSPVVLGGAPLLFPLSLFDEGHTGVALFMTLSGYLFAKLLDGKRIHYGAFLWNRALRLLPLLALVILVVGIQRYNNGADMGHYARRIVSGVIKPGLPHGGWSITIEFHFYLLLPLLLWIARKSRFALLAVIAAAVLGRAVLYRSIGNIQFFSYWTIVGRIDQFLFGIVAYQFRELVAGRHIIAVSGLLAFCAFYWWFDRVGGFYRIPPGSFPTYLWIFIPTLEGLAYGLAIAWYDSSFRASSHWLARAIAQIGAYSYSIYLLHFFVVFRMSRFVDRELLDLSSIYTAMTFSLLAFLCMAPVGYLSYRFIEAPALRLRRPYVIDERQKA